LEHAFDSANRMLDSDAHAGFPPIRRAQLWRRRATMNEVAGVGRAYAERGRLSRVRRVAPDAPFGAMQQPWQDVTVVGVGRGGLDGVNKLALAVDAEVTFHPEIPLLAFPRLMHRRIAGTGRVLRRPRRTDDGRVDDRAGAHGDAAVAQIRRNGVEQDAAQAVLFEQVAELADGRLVRHRLVSEIDADEGPHDRRVV